jgi:hypothetical protein
MSLYDKLKNWFVGFFYGFDPKFLIKDDEDRDYHTRFISKNLKNKEEIENKYVKQIYLMLRLYLVFYVILSLIFYMLDENSAWKDLDLIVYIISSGGVGATLCAMRALAFHTSIANFKVKWVTWYYYRPLMGSIAGFFIYVLIMGGVYIVDQGGAAADTNTIYFYCAIAFLTGFSIKPFIDKIRELSKSFFGQASKELEEMKGSLELEKKKIEDMKTNMEDEVNKKVAEKLEESREKMEKEILDKLKDDDG